MTYSIVARDPNTGELGVAVQSHWFAAGQLVMWAEPAVGAVATQAEVNVSYGPRGLGSMREGAAPQDALTALTREDDHPEARQVAFVDATGRVATHTGSNCIRMAGHRAGEGYSVQANMMGTTTVWDAMAEAFEGSGGDLTHRLLDALDAAEDAGGDIRGRQAAGILVVRALPTSEPWTDTLVHVTVDDHPAPLTELRRLVHVKDAYDRLERAEDLELEGDTEGALREREIARAALPDNPELAFWAGVSLALAGRFDEARKAMSVATGTHDGWAELLRRMVHDGQIGLTDETVREALVAVTDPKDMQAPSGLHEDRALDREDLADDPIEQFSRWLADAEGAGVPLPNAMALATADAHGRPSVRHVLLRGVDERGFTFFTNHGSRKGRQLADNPFAGLVFLWKRLDRQVSVTGAVEALDAEESDAYFATRPREAQLGAWASRQSEVLDVRDALDDRMADADARFPGDVPRPPHWGGYLVRPDSVEFWQGRRHRLHDRFRYRRDPRAGSGWEIERLYP